jgi:hypothetical protein
MSRPFIEIEITSLADFEVDDLWPDGDAPEVITKEAVQALVDKESPRRLMDEWFFPLPDIRIRVVTPGDTE